MIDGAAAGNCDDRERFAQFYLGVIRAYFRARWGKPEQRQMVDDAVQEVFVELFRPNGPLDRAQRDTKGGFRAYLFGVVRNIGLRFESRQAANQPADSRFILDEVADSEQSLSEVFDQAWANLMMRKAAEHQAEKAVGDADAEKRIELLRMRFEHDLPIREIAKLWDVEAGKLHRDYARSREEFRKSLFEVVAEHHCGLTADVEKECLSILRMLRR